MLRKIKKTTIWLSIFFGLVILPISAVESQNIDEKYLQFLPVESEMKGYNLKWLSHFFWQVGEDKTQYMVDQMWTSNDEEAKELYIAVCIFDSASEAITGTSYYKGTFSGINLWGSIGGSINGEHSWCCPYYREDPVQFIVRGNVGIKIWKSRPDQPDFISFADIVSLMLNKIENNLPADVLLAEEEAKRNQISREKYQQLTVPVLALDETQGFTLLKEWDSKWVVDKNTFACGRRSEWENETGTIIGIDICEFETDAAARSSAERQAVTTNCKTFDMADISTLQAHIDRWNKTIGYGKYISVVSYKGRIAVYIYQYNPEVSNTHIFQAVAYELVEQTNFLVSSAVSEEGGTTEGLRAFKLYQNTPNPFNPSTTIRFSIPNDGFTTLAIYNITGQKIRELISGNIMTGAHSIVWDGRDESGSTVSTGIYFSRLTMGDRTASSRMMLVK